MTYLYKTVPSPCGEMLIVASEKGIRQLDFLGEHTKAEHTMDNLGSDYSPGTNKHIEDCSAQLAAYFAGDLQDFDLSLDAAGTDFQHIVWRALCDIPYGTTCSYGELATRIGKPTASRAVGAANGRNPIAVIVPCHRVIGANGTLTGYAGGIDRKRVLLSLESSQADLL